MDDQRKDHIDPEGTPPGNRPEQLQTNNLSTDEAKVQRVKFKEMHYDRYYS